MRRSSTQCRRPRTWPRKLPRSSHESSHASSHARLALYPPRTSHLAFCHHPNNYAYLQLVIHTRTTRNSTDPFNFYHKRKPPGRLSSRSDLYRRCSNSQTINKSLIFTTTNQQHRIAISCCVRYRILNPDSQ